MYPPPQLQNPGANTVFYLSKCMVSVCWEICTGICNGRILFIDFICFSNAICSDIIGKICVNIGITYDLKVYPSQLKNVYSILCKQFVVWNSFSPKKALPMSGPAILPSLSASTKGQGGGVEGTDSAFMPSQVRKILCDCWTYLHTCTYKCVVYTPTYTGNVTWCTYKVYDVTRIIDLLDNFASASIYGFVSFCESLFITISFRWEQHYSPSVHTVHIISYLYMCSVVIKHWLPFKKKSIIPTLPNHLMSSWWKQ